MSEPSVLMVPVHIDALVLRQDRAVVDALADFTRLPYSDGRRDVNSDIGYLSEAILTDPSPIRACGCRPECTCTGLCRMP